MRYGATGLNALTHVRAGDVIAFNGREAASGLVRFATRSNVSHVGIIMGRIDGQSDALIIESTSLDGATGVMVNNLSGRLEQYQGDAWWLPLSDASRARLDADYFRGLLTWCLGAGYDFKQAAMSAVDGLVPDSHEDYRKLFCSELAAAALEAGGVLRNVNASEITPIDLCRMAIFSPDYYQVLGKPREIEGYNTIIPSEVA